MWKSLEKRPFFRADMAGLGKYCMGGYGRIGVYMRRITILSAIVQGVLGPGHIEEPYALDDMAGSGYSPTRCSPTAHLMNKYDWEERVTAASKR